MSERDAVAAATCCSPLCARKLATLGSRFPENWLLRRDARELIIGVWPKVKVFRDCCALPVDQKLIGCVVAQIIDLL
jgi:hypothetical protein